MCLPKELTQLPFLLLLVYVIHCLLWFWEICFISLSFLNWIWSCRPSSHIRHFHCGNAFDIVVIRPLTNGSRLNLGLPSIRAVALSYTRCNTNILELIFTHMTVFVFARLLLEIRASHKSWGIRCTDFDHAILGECAVSTRPTARFFVFLFQKKQSLMFNRDPSALFIWKVP